MTDQTKHNEFMDKAATLSLERMRANLGGPFGAVVVKDGKVIAHGFNQVSSTNDPTAHAEVVAIREACKAIGDFSLEGAEIYTSCEPCPMCLASIYWARISKIYYAQTREDAARIGFDDEFLYQEVAKPLDQRSIPIVHLPNKIANQAMQEWQEKPDKIEY